MDDGSQPEMDAMAAQLWPGVVEQIDQLVGLADEERRWSTTAGSPLAGDDRATRPYQLSHAFQLLLNAGIDNLNGVRHLTFGRPVADHGGEMVIHQAAHYVLARGAIENFATALWILGPRGRPERVERVLRWHAKNINDQHSALDRFGATEGRSRTDKLADLERLLTASAGHAGKAPRGYTTTEVVQYADEFRATTGHLTTHFIWQLCSGFAHARPWASLTFLERDLHPTEDPDVLQARLTSSMGRALLAPQHALDLCSSLLERHQRLNTPAFG